MFSDKSGIVIFRMNSKLATSKPDITEKTNDWYQNAFTQYPFKSSFSKVSEDLFTLAFTNIWTADHMFFIF